MPSDSAKSDSGPLQNMNVVNWLFSLGKRERELTDAASRLQLRMRTTAKCRYNAATRLQHLSKFSFFTATILALGLIFIPLMQSASVQLALSDKVLNVIQIFLAVAVLVYSVVIGTAHYDVRASQLTDCGDKLKELIREIEGAKDAFTNIVLPATMDSLNDRYSDIVSDVENHGRNDYRFAQLEMTNDYFITGLPRLITRVQANLIHMFGFVVPMFLILVELTAITDMMGVTNVFAPYLHSAAN